MYIYQALPKIRKLLTRLTTLAEARELSRFSIGRVGYVLVQTPGANSVRSHSGTSWFQSRVDTNFGSAPVYGLTYGSEERHALSEHLELLTLFQPELHRYFLCHLVGQQRKSSALDLITREANRQQLHRVGVSWGVKLDLEAREAYLAHRLTITTTEGNKVTRELGVETIDLATYLESEGQLTLPLLHV